MERRLLRLGLRRLVALAVVGFLAMAFWSSDWPRTGGTSSSDTPIAQDDLRCWIGINIRTDDDLRAGREAFATIEVLFWRGERISGQLAKHGEGISGNQARNWRFPAHRPDDPYRPDRPSTRYQNKVRRITLTYKLDPGDGLLLRPDTWSFSRPRMSHYCDLAGVSERNDIFFTAPTRLPELGELRFYVRQRNFELNGTNTITLYEDTGTNPSVCERDRDCDDGLVCNGSEICKPGQPGSNVEGCRPGSPPRCNGNESCFERFGSPARPGPFDVLALFGGCMPNSCSQPDRDGDHFARKECGGQDCNDNDFLMKPGTSDYWDAQNKDNDCNPATSGARVFFRVAQVCDGEASVIVIGESGGGDRLRRVACSRGSVCVPQPSGEGVCAGRPDGYIAPPLFSAPLIQGGYEPGWLPLYERSIKGRPGTDISPVVRPTPKIIPIKP